MASASVLAQLDAAFTDFAAQVRRILADSTPQPATTSSLGQLIRASRVGANLTFEEVARAAGLTKGYIWQLEQERNTNPSVLVCAKLAEALGQPFTVVCHAALVSARRVAENQVQANADGAGLVTFWKLRGRVPPGSVTPSSK